MLRFILFLVLAIFVARALWRILDGIVEGASGPRTRGQAPDRGVSMVRDPVCGTFVVPSRALTGGTGADMRFFCSENCRRTYEMTRAQ